MWDRSTQHPLALPGEEFQPPFDLLDQGPGGDGGPTELVEEVAVEVTETEHGWSPTMSLEDAYKLDDVREALKAGDLNAAAQYEHVYELRPVISA